MNSDILTNHEPVRGWQVKTIQQPLDLRSWAALGSAFQGDPGSRLQSLVNERVVEGWSSILR